MSGVYKIVDGTGAVTCTSCAGRGEVDSGSYYAPEVMPCPTCGGHGVLPQVPRSEWGPGVDGVIYRDKPNLFGLDTYHQDKVWTDASGKTWRLDEMAPSHRRNLLAWMERNAASIELADGMAFAMSPFAPSGDMASMDFERYLDERGDDPFAWLKTTPLYERLAALVAGDHQAHADLNALYADEVW